MKSKVKLEFPCGCVFSMKGDGKDNLGLCKIHSKEFERQTQYKFTDVQLGIEMKRGLGFFPIKTKRLIEENSVTTPKGLTCPHCKKVIILKSIIDRYASKMENRNREKRKEAKKILDSIEK